MPIVLFYVGISRVVRETPSGLPGYGRAPNEVLMRSEKRTSLSELEALDRGYPPASGTGQIDYFKKSETYESYRRPDGEGRNGRARQRFGSVR